MKVNKSLKVLKGKSEAVNRPSMSRSDHGKPQKSIYISNISGAQLPFLWMKMCKFGTVIYQELGHLRCIHPLYHIENPLTQETNVITK